MTERIMLVSSLRDGTDRSEFEGFVREVLLPLARDLPSVRAYDVLALRGLTEESGEPAPGDYADIIEVTSVEAYGRDLEGMLGTERGQEFEQRWQAYVARYVSVQCEPVE